jgi:uncharacterized protein
MLRGSQGLASQHEGRLKTLTTLRRELLRALKSCLLQILVFICLLLTTPAWADPSFPALSGPVVDAANILSADEEVILDNKIRALKDKSGHQMNIATVPSLEGYDIADYGNRLFRFWQLGDKTANDGVLLLIAPNERKVRIEVGYGLEGDMTDAISSVIINHDMIPRFKTGDWSGGLVLGVDDVEKVIGGDGSQIVERVQNQSAPDIENWIPIIIFIIIVFIILSNVSRGGRAVRGSGRGTSSTYGGGWSSGGGGGWSSGGGGGGWSGGGGSSGGGGASGGW